MESPETYPVKKAGELIGKAPNTVRTWSGEDLFGPYLSPYANPEPGAERRYTENDIRILRTASILQRRGLKIKDILPRIASGEILEELETFEEESPETAESPRERSTSLPARIELSNQIELFIRPYESQISRLSAELEREREELEKEREARIAAEKELSRLSAKLEERSLPWYKRLFGGEP